MRVRTVRELFTGLYRRVGSVLAPARLIVQTVAVSFLQYSSKTFTRPLTHFLNSRSSTLATCFQVILRDYIIACRFKKKTANNENPTLRLLAGSEKEKF